MLTYSLLQILMKKVRSACWVRISGNLPHPESQPYFTTSKLCVSCSFGRWSLSLVVDERSFLAGGKEQKPCHRPHVDHGGKFGVYPLNDFCREEIEKNLGVIGVTGFGST